MTSILTDPSAANQPLLFEDLQARQVVADFSGGHVSSDGGCLLLRQLDGSLGLSRKLAGCFSDARHPNFIEHELRELIAQRVLGIAAGYEDLNDHNSLRLDPLLATAVNKVDPLGLNRRHPEDKGKALAGASTLNRLELGNDRSTRCHKIAADHEAIEDLLIFMGVQTLAKDTAEVVIDLDATNDPLHGQQEGLFYHGYYKEYCYLPLHAFIGSVPVWAQLRGADQDASKGSVHALEKIVAAIRKRCPQAIVIVRGDSGFARDQIMSWCEHQQPLVYYCFGLQKNSVLIQRLAEPLAQARAQACVRAGQGRAYGQFEYITKKNTWSRVRRVIGKAEIISGQDNPRFVVTNLPEDGFGAAEADRFDPRSCYEDFYCARGDMENRIKEQQLDLFGDRTSTHFMQANQLRLWFSAFAQLLLERLRTVGLKGTQLATATAGTIRTRLLKIGAIVTVSTRRIYVRLASAFPLRDIFSQAQRALSRFSP